MKNIQAYSDQELSLTVFNDFDYYRERHNTVFLMALIQENFIYSEGQMDVLKQDLADDKGHDQYWAENSWANIS